MSAFNFFFSPLVSVHGKSDWHEFNGLDLCQKLLKMTCKHIPLKPSQCDRG